MDNRGGVIRSGAIRSWVDRSIGSGMMDYRGRVIRGGGSMDSVMYRSMDCVMYRVSHGVNRVSQVRSVVTVSHESAVMTVMDHVGGDVSHRSGVDQSNQSQHTRKSLEISENFIQCLSNSLWWSTGTFCLISHASRKVNTLYLHFCDVALK